MSFTNACDQSASDTHWWNVAVSETVRAKIAWSAPSIADGGVASAALYDLCRDAGLKPIRQYPFSVASEGAEGPVFTFPEMYALAQLTPDEREQFGAAKARAIADGTLFMTRMHHCFVGEVAA